MNVKLIGKHEKDSRACRDGLALTLDEMMAQDKSICYVDCDLMGCINTKRLREHYPDRAFEAGIAEGNAAGVSAGLAATGKKVFFHSFGTFSSRRCYDQIYMSAAYAGLTVHVLGSDAGVTAAFNGGTCRWRMQPCTSPSPKPQCWTPPTMTSLPVSPANW